MVSKQKEQEQERKEPVKLKVMELPLTVRISGYWIGQGTYGATGLLFRPDNEAPIGISGNVVADIQDNIDTFRRIKDATVTIEKLHNKKTGHDFYKITKIQVHKFKVQSKQTVQTQLVIDEDAEASEQEA